MTHPTLNPYERLPTHIAEPEIVEAIREKNSKKIYFIIRGKVHSHPLSDAFNQELEPLVLAPLMPEPEGLTLPEEDGELWVYRSGAVVKK